MTRRIRPPRDDDPCVVWTLPLRTIMMDFVSRWLKTRPSTAGRYLGSSRVSTIQPVGPYVSLSLDTGIERATLEKVRDPSRYPLCELRVADSIISSIGEPLSFYELTIMPNPRVRPARVECCGGSSTTMAYPAVDGAIISSNGPIYRPDEQQTG